MKKAFIWMVMLVLTVILTSCHTIKIEKYDIDSIKSYKDVPGVTEEEIAAIETLKEKKEGFSYGHVMETEAFQVIDGTYAGFTYQFCEYLTDLFDAPFQPEYYEAWDDLKSGLDEGSIDFMGGMTPTVERMQTYVMTHAIAERALRIYTHVGSKEPESEYDVEGMTIGFLTGTITADQIKKYYPISFQEVEVSSFSMAAGKLETGELDAFVTEAVAEPAFEEYDFVRSKEFFPLAYTSVSMTTANEELQPIISVVDKFILAGGIDKLFLFYKEGDYEYAKHRLSSSFTKEETAYIEDLEARGAKVRVAMENENYPVCFYNGSEKEYQGIAPDVLSQISGLTGIEFEVVETRDMAWAEVQKQLETGEISMVSQLLCSDKDKVDYLLSDVPYMSSHYAFLSKTEQPNISSYQIVRSTVGIVDYPIYRELYQSWFPESENWILYDTFKKALDALEKGRVDLLLATDDFLLNQSNYREKTGYKVNIRFSAIMDSQFGFRKEDGVLRSIIDKAQAYVDIEAIQRDWTSRVFDYSKKMNHLRTMYLLVFSIILLLGVFLLLYLLLKNVRLGKNLERQSATLSTIYASIPDLVFCKDTNGNYISCNPSFERFAGRSKDEIIGRKAADVFQNNAEMARNFMEADKGMLSDESMKVVEEWITFPDGTHRFVETIRTPLLQNKTLIGLMGISRDVTDRKASEEAALVASKAKSAFLAHMSHEIRTPLNAIVGMANIMKGSLSDKEKLLSSISQIITSSHHLLGILNDVLDMSKIESGKLELTHEPFRLLDTYQTVTERVRLRCVKKDLQLITNIEEVGDLELVGDPLRLSQILTNLLENAVKFTDRGGIIRLGIHILEETKKHARIAFDVSDNGIGMSQEQLDKLFIPFEQTDHVIASKFGGTGLGLSISQNLVNRMGGRIQVESQKNVGSKFSFELVMEKAEDVETTFKASAAMDLSNKRVLIVEDVEINRFIIRELLLETGIQIDMAVNGQEAVDKFEKSPIGYYDLIFMDIQMPILNGYEATKKIRALMREDAGSVPIIAITAQTNKEDADQAFEAGMNRHLSKPIDLKAIRKAIRDFTIEADRNGRMGNDGLF